MRRITTGVLAFLALAAAFLVLPVVGDGGAEPRPVTTSTEKVALGSVATPHRLRRYDGTPRPSAASGRARPRCI